MNCCLNFSFVFSLKSKFCKIHSVDVPDSVGIGRMVVKKCRMDHELTTNASHKWWVGYFASSPPQITSAKNSCIKQTVESTEMIFCYYKQSKILATQLPVDHLALTYFDFFFVIHTNKPMYFSDYAIFYDLYLKTSKPWQHYLCLHGYGSR